MILIENNESFYFPKHFSCEPATLELKSELSQKIYTFEVSDEGELDDYFIFSIDFSEIEEGEYIATVRDNDNVPLSVSLLRVGAISAVNMEYNNNEEYIEYKS